MKIQLVFVLYWDPLYVTDYSYELALLNNHSFSILVTMRMWRHSVTFWTRNVNQMVGTLESMLTQLGNTI